MEFTPQIYKSLYLGTCLLVRSYLAKFHKLRQYLCGRIDVIGQLTILFNTCDGVDNAYTLVLDIKVNKISWMNQLEEGAIMQRNLDGSGTPHTLIENMEISFVLAVE